MTKKSDRPDLVVCVSDQHTNSRVGLCPAEVELEYDGSYTPGRVQQESLKAWLEFWNLIKRKKKTAGTVYVVSCGDMMDRNRHDRMDPISPYAPDILRMAYQLWKPIAKLADHLFVIRGTEAHTGEHNELEELLASELKAEPDTLSNMASWYWLPLEINGVTFDIAHHPGTAGYRAHTHGTAPARESAEIALRSSEMGVKPPDIAIRGHTHNFEDSGKTRRPQVFYLPSWKIADGYEHRRGAGGTIKAIGGLWFECRDGRYQWDKELWQPKRRQAWQPTK